MDNVVYAESIRNSTEIQPAIRIDCKIISCAHDLLEHKSETVIVKNLKKFRYYLLNGCKIYIALYRKPRYTATSIRIAAKNGTPMAKMVDRHFLEF